MEAAIKAVMAVLPLIFGVGFLAPVIAAAIELTGLSASLPFSPLSFGLCIGGFWGLLATVSGRWI